MPTYRDPPAAVDRIERTPLVDDRARANRDPTAVRPFGPGRTARDDRLAPAPEQAPDLMGAFANASWIAVLAWFTTALIAVLNAILLYYIVRNWMGPGH